MVTRLNDGKWHELARSLRLWAETSSGLTKCVAQKPHASSNKQSGWWVQASMKKNNNNSSAMIQQNSGDHVMQVQGNPQLLHHTEHLQTWFKSRPVLAKVGDTSTMAAAVKQALFPKYEQPFSNVNPVWSSLVNLHCWQICFSRCLSSPKRQSRLRPVQVLHDHVALQLFPLWFENCSATSVAAFLVLRSTQRASFRSPTVTSFSVLRKKKVTCVRLWAVAK